MINLGVSFDQLPLLFIYSRKNKHPINSTNKLDTYIINNLKPLKSHFKTQL